MFSYNSSYVAILLDIAHQCHLPYISCIHEVIEDGTDIYGIEIQLPPNVIDRNLQTLFFWANPDLDHALAYEAAALQALVALQRIYGSVVVDYSIHELQLCRAIARRLLPVANRGTQLARLVIAASQHQNIPLSTLTAYAQQLLYEVATISRHSTL